MSLSPFFQNFLDPWLMIFADDPFLRGVQGGLLLGAILLIFLVFYATRDILQRTHSFWYMLFSIVLVAFLPVVGFLLYLIIRPTRTLWEREMEDVLRDIHGDITGDSYEEVAEEQKPKTKSVKKDIAKSSESA